MSRTYTPTELSFIELYSQYIRERFTPERWAENYPNDAYDPEEIAKGLIECYSPIYDAFKLGLSVKREDEPVPDRGLWTAHFNTEEGKTVVSLQSDDFDADVAIYARVTGDFGHPSLKLAYAKRLVRLMNEAVMRGSPAPSDNHLGYMTVTAQGYARTYMGPELKNLAPGHYSLYATPTPVTPEPLGVNRNLLNAAQSILRWSKYRFLDNPEKDLTPRRLRKRDPLYGKQIATPEEFKELRAAVKAAQAPK